MMYLLDTNVVSELRKVEAGRADPRVQAWERRTDAASLFISIVTVLELELGALLMERRDQRQGRVLRSWLEDQILPAFANRILVADVAIARRAAILQVPDPRPYRDALIAATAVVHGFTVVTRNIRDFQSVGVPLINPWED
jgi:predicted nucleic acid-binding protein